MMTKTTTKKRARMKAIALVPVIIAAICLFSTKVWANNEAENFGTQLTGSLPQEDPIIIPGKGVSPEQMNEYKAIVDKYLESDNGYEVKWKNMTLTTEDRNRLYILFVQMDTTQQEQQRIRFAWTKKGSDEFNQLDKNGIKQSKLMEIEAMTWFVTGRDSNKKEQSYKEGLLEEAKEQKKTINQLTPASYDQLASRPLPIPSEPATDAQMEEYASITSKFITKEEGGIRISGNMSKEEENRLKELFLFMNTEQRSRQKITFAYKQPYKKMDPPSEDEYNSWKDSKTHVVYVNGNIIDNTKLNDYKNTDFTNFVSRLITINAKYDYGSGFSYDCDYIVTLYTTEYLDEMNKKIMANTNLHLDPFGFLFKRNN